jgi:hypothetical protein
MKKYLPESFWSPIILLLCGVLILPFVSVRGQDNREMKGKVINATDT